MIIIILHLLIKLNLFDLRILNDNQLSGAIPTELGSLGKLQYL